MPVFKHTILYVDDDRDDLMIITDAFRMHTDGVDIITALNGEEALSMLDNMKSEGHAPCLIILDINMPLISGKDLLKQLKQSGDFDTVPIVLLSTSSSPDDMTFARQHRTDFFTKPATFPELQMLIRELTDKCSVA